MTPTTELQKPIIKTELPGPHAREIIAADEKYVTPSYPRPDYKLVAEKGYGVWLEDVDGNVFLRLQRGRGGLFDRTLPSRDRRGDYQTNRKR